MLLQAFHRTASPVPNKHALNHLWSFVFTFNFPVYSSWGAKPKSFLFLNCVAKYTGKSWLPGEMANGGIMTPQWINQLRVTTHRWIHYREVPLSIPSSIPLSSLLISAIVSPCILLSTPFQALPHFLYRSLPPSLPLITLFDHPAML
jgi:hypothetical protein